MSNNNPTRGFRTIDEFRQAEPELSDEQAEAIWEYFPRERKPPCNGHAESIASSSSEITIRDVLSTSVGKTLLGTAAFLAIALLFPPFYVQLPEGMSMNLGFNFLFDPPKQGQLVARVDVALLITELTVISTCGAVAVYLASRLRKK